jgi:hemerythrin-like domain-containing protein
MKPIEELKHEHDSILSMLSGAERLAQTIQTTHDVDVKKVESIINFSRHFTDGCHHAKEEKQLFVRLQERGMPKGQGPIVVMLKEHQVGRNLIKGIESVLQEFKTGDQEAYAALSRTLVQYVELLRTHIAKENTILFPMSNNLLTPEDQKELEESFKFIEEHEVGPGVHEKYHLLAHEIAH